nr:hypothetical protein [uncultured Sphaerochaeta sp.]
MKKKFVLTLALVLMVAGTLVAATPIEVSGTFKTGYTFSFNPNGITQVEDDTEAKLATNVAFTGDFWKVSLKAGEDVLFDDEYKVDAKAELYLDKALAEQGMDMGDLALTLHVGSGVGTGALSVLADEAEFRDGLGIKFTSDDNFGVTVKYSDMVEVYASVDPTDTANYPMVLSAKLMPVDGVSAAVGYSNDFNGGNGLAVSAKGDVAALVDLDFALAATGEFLMDVTNETSMITADVVGEYEGIGLWVAFQNDHANVNKLAAKASYSTTVEDFDVSASFKAEMLDLSDIANNTTYTVEAGAKYAMGGATYALDAKYVIDGAFTLSPSVSIAF